MQVIRKHVCTGHRAAIYALVRGTESGHFFSAGGEGWIVDWDLANPDLGRLIAQTEQQIFSLCLLPDGRLVAGAMNGGMHWIDPGQQTPPRLIQAHRKGVFDLLWLDGMLLSAGGDGILTWWDPATLQARYSLQLAHAALRCMAYAPQRGELAVGSSDHRIFFIDPHLPGLKATVRQAHLNSVFALAYAPDNRTLLSGGRDAYLRVWAAEGGADSIPWPSERSPREAAHMFTINHIAYSPDGRYFATASRDKTLKIWDADTCTLLKVLDTIRHGGHVNSVNRLLWLDEVLISAGDDRSAMLWQLD